MKGSSGDDYVVDKVQTSQHYYNNAILTYATAVRANGERNGKALGVLGVHFDWEEQGRSVVRDEPSFKGEEWERARVLLLDADHLCIAASDGAGIGHPFNLKLGKESVGAYTERNELVVYARTQGYEAYDGLGWIGVVVQSLK